jgi:hypothetical protein
MNIYHLELFYFVAKHGGIAAAVRNVPYGIQQPATSGQIARLEESLGTKAFQRIAAGFSRRTGQVSWCADRTEQGRPTKITILLLFNIPASPRRSAVSLNIMLALFGRACATFSC